METNQDVGVFDPDEETPSPFLTRYPVIGKTVRAAGNMIAGMVICAAVLQPVEPATNLMSWQTI